MKGGLLYQVENEDLWNEGSRRRKIFLLTGLAVPIRQLLRCNCLTFSLNTKLKGHIMFVDVHCSSLLWSANVQQIITLKEFCKTSNMWQDLWSCLITDDLPCDGVGDILHIISEWGDWGRVRVTAINGQRILSVKSIETLRHDCH